MDLISRKAAIDALMHILDIQTHAEFLYTDEICKTMNSIPSAPAVPLDKLCEWLAKNASWYAAEIDGDPEEWKSILTEWMEEQDE